MNILVVLGHQRQGSFCHAIANTVCEELKAAGHSVVFHDLYAERFDPIMPDDEVQRGGKLDPVVQQHCDEVLKADGYVIVHPNWWAMPPAMLKGWVDRVFRQGTTYEFGPNGPNGFLKGRPAVVFTTSNTPRDVELAVYGDPLENLWKTCIFSLVGVTDFLRRNYESVIMSTPEQRADWLEETRKIVREKFPRR